MTHFHYLYCPEFSCIIKLSSSGTELQRISIPRSDLMKLALVCWENSIDKLESEREQQKYNTARKILHRVKKLCYNSRRRLSLAVFQVMQQQLSGKSKELIILWSSVRFRPVAPVYASMMEEVVIPDLKSDAFQACQFESGYSHQVSNRKRSS